MRKPINEIKGIIELKPLNTFPKSLSHSIHDRDLLIHFMFSVIVLKLQYN